MTMNNETVLTGAPHPGTELEIIKSPNGYFYIGYRDTDGSPYSRESEYFSSALLAKQVFNVLRGGGI